MGYVPAKYQGKTQWGTKGPGRIGWIEHEYATIFFHNDTLSIACIFLSSAEDPPGAKCYLYQEVSFRHDGVWLQGWVSSVDEQAVIIGPASMPYTVDCTDVRLPASVDISLDLFFADALAAGSEEIVARRTCAQLRRPRGAPLQCELAQSTLTVEQGTQYTLSQVGLTHVQAHEIRAIASHGRFTPTLAKLLVRDGVSLASGERLREELLLSVAMRNVFDAENEGLQPFAIFLLIVGDITCIILSSIGVVFLVLVCQYERASHKNQQWAARNTVKTQG